MSFQQLKEIVKTRKVEAQVQLGRLSEEIATVNDAIEQQLKRIRKQTHEIRDLEREFHTLSELVKKDLMKHKAKIHSMVTRKISMEDERDRLKVRLAELQTEYQQTQELLVELARKEEKYRVVAGELAAKENYERMRKEDDQLEELALLKRKVE